MASNRLNAYKKRYSSNSRRNNIGVVSQKIYGHSENKRIDRALLHCQMKRTRRRDDNRNLKNREVLDVTLIYSSFDDAVKAGVCEPETWFDSMRSKAIQRGLPDPAAPYRPSQAQREYSNMTLEEKIIYNTEKAHKLGLNTLEGSELYNIWNNFSLSKKRSESKKFQMRQAIPRGKKKNNSRIMRSRNDSRY